MTVFIFFEIIDLSHVIPHIERLNLTGGDLHRMNPSNYFFSLFPPPPHQEKSS